ncbi:MAG TPA: transcription-repair coupling factor [candidate division Zixibacteria bacterium]|nr:transcription-repair coupling factor [candidate division Zixibacteria bacterium]
MLWDDIGGQVTASPPLRKLLQLAGSGAGRFGITGACESGKALAVSALFSENKRTILWLVPTPEEAERQRDNLAALLGEEAVRHWACWEILPGEEREPDEELVGSRMECLQALASGRPVIVVASARSLLQNTLSRGMFERLTLRLSLGQRIDRDQLPEQLVRSGFERQPAVAGIGDFAVRGSIIDIAGFGPPEPVRLELDEDDRIASLRHFSLADQRSTTRLEAAVILPGKEADPKGSPLPAHLPEDALVCWDEPGESLAGFEEVAEELETFGRDARYGLFADCRPMLESRRMVLMTSGAGFGVADLPQPEEAVRIPVRPVEPFMSNLKLLRERLEKLRSDGVRTLVLTDTPGQMERMREILDGFGPGFSQGLQLAGLHGGFHLPEAGLWAATEREIFARQRRRRTRRFQKGGGAIRSLDQLKFGDYMVHVDYGICRYQGLVQTDMGGQPAECLLLVFRDNDKLYVPIDQMKRVQRFSSEEGYQPALSKLGSGQWEETKARVKRAAKDMAQELLALYARRKSEPGRAFGPDTAWQRELEAAFPYEETADQSRAIEEVKSDMESEQPMDRLLCGDVGYGKTEVAVRATFKAVMGGAQAAVLAPTTVLAEQHYLTFRERMADYPVRIEMLSRFRRPAEQRAVARAVAAGEVDILIGTHRILQKDVSFKNLGLLVVDEEQRFGVGHKERIKRLCCSVDVLTMTATPIPRTLHMSLLGVRDVSNIETPPRDRLAVLTEVMPWDERRIQEAVQREVDRGGQVFFLHNRVQSIAAMAAMLARLLPGVEMVTAHGQMEPRELERAMLAFNSRRYDLLLATTIIESGLDMPNVNTIIINRADRFGLAQLYQLRGRVGRSDRRAYAYLMVPKGGRVNEVARKRLRIIEELSELGSGFKLALRDLEIRGAGNLLGREQHGHMMSVGFELYCQLLEEAVRELKGLTPIPQINVIIETDRRAVIPAEYVEEGDERINLYRRLNRAPDPGAVGELAGELADRFGPLPPPAERLVNVARLRLAAARLGADRLEWQGSNLTFRWPEGRDPSRQTLEHLIKTVALPIEFVAGRRFAAMISLGRDFEAAVMAEALWGKG